MKSIKSLKTDNMCVGHSGYESIANDFLDRADVILDMEDARNYLNCIPSYALELRQWFAGDNYPNLAEVAFQKIKQANRKFEYSDDKLRSDWRIDNVYNQQEAF